MSPPTLVPDAKSQNGPVLENTWRVGISIESKDLPLYDHKSGERWLPEEISEETWHKVAIQLLTPTRLNFTGFGVSVWWTFDTV